MGKPPPEVEDLMQTLKAFVRQKAPGAAELELSLSSVSPEVRDLVAALRALVLETVTGVTEGIRFGALCYFRAGEPFGSIGGNVCMIELRDEKVALAFLHGASLPDPTGLLTGSTKAKRRVPIRDKVILRQEALRDLLRAAWAHRPRS